MGKVAEVGESLVDPQAARVDRLLSALLLQVPDPPLHMEMVEGPFLPFLVEPYSQDARKVVAIDNKYMVLERMVVGTQEPLLTKEEQQDLAFPSTFGPLHGVVLV